MRDGLVLNIIVYTVLICGHFVVANDDSTFSGAGEWTYNRGKRGVVKESADLLAKGGKYAILLWRYYKAKRVLLRDAEMIGESYGSKLYVKFGDRGKALSDFYLTFPDKLKVKGTDPCMKIGVIGNKQINIVLLKGTIEFQSQKDVQYRTEKDDEQRNSDMRDTSKLNRARGFKNNGSIL